MILKGGHGFPLQTGSTPAVTHLVAAQLCCRSRPKVDLLGAGPGRRELSERLHLLPDDLNPSFVGGIELQHSLSVQDGTEGATGRG